MNNEAESSRAGERSAIDYNEAEDAPEYTADAQPEETAAQKDFWAKERRVDAKRKRIRFLEHLLRELDALVYLELITLYHLDCSFFWFLLRALIQASFFTPLSDIALDRKNEEYKPFLPVILIPFVTNIALHLTFPNPATGEDTRGYLHGGLMIDFIGQQGPTPKWKLASLDVALLILQMMVVTVHAKRREAKKTLASISGGSVSTTNETDADASTETAEADAENAARNQDMDAEERGVLRRTDTLSDIGADDEEDALLPATETGSIDALDFLTTGQCVIGEFTLFDTMLSEHYEYTALAREHGGYSAFSQPHDDTTVFTAPSNVMRQLRSARMRFGAGGG